MADPVLSLEPGRVAPNGVAFVGEFVLVPVALLMEGRRAKFQAGGVKLLDASPNAAIHDAGGPMAGWGPVGLTLQKFTFVSPQKSAQLTDAEVRANNTPVFAGDFAAFVRTAAATDVFANGSGGAPVALTADSPFVGLGCAIADGLGASGDSFQAPWGGVLTSADAGTAHDVEQIHWDGEKRVVDATFRPRMFYNGSPVCNSYAPVADKSAKWLAYEAVTDIRGRCTGAAADNSGSPNFLGALDPMAPACTDALKKMCQGSSGNSSPNFTAPVCSEWQKNSRTGKIAIDGYISDWCAANPGDARCQCMRAVNDPDDPAWVAYQRDNPSAAGLPPQCVYPPCQGKSGEQFVTSEVAGAAGGTLCTGAIGVADRQKQIDALAQDQEAQQLERARRRVELMNAYQAEQFVPLWQWILFAALVVVVLAVFFGFSREKISTTVYSPSRTNQPQFV